MPAGAPGDHPVTDIVEWKRSRFGATVDANVRKLANLLSQEELFSWWDDHVGSNKNKGHVGRMVERKLHWAERRAREQGWEVGE